MVAKVCGSRILTTNSFSHISWNKHHHNFYESYVKPFVKLENNFRFEMEAALFIKSVKAGTGQNVGSRIL